MELSKLLGLVRLTNQFQAMQRHVLAHGEQRHENDAEHSFQLAFFAWYIVNSFGSPLRKDLVVKYGLIHDLVEVYAGDTYIYDPDPAVHESKAERERVAAVRLREGFPEFTDLHELIVAYEERQDAESRFVYALDKVLPMMNIYLDDGRMWRQERVDLQMLIDNKKSKVAISPEVDEIFDNLIKELKAMELELFGKVTTIEYEKVQS